MLQDFDEDFGGGLHGVDALDQFFWIAIDDRFGFRAIDVESGLDDVFVYCSPCTGGSTWQRLTLDLAKRSVWEMT